MSWLNEPPKDERPISVGELRDLLVDVPNDTPLWAMYRDQESGLRSSMYLPLRLVDIARTSDNVLHSIVFILPIVYRKAVEKP